VSGRCRASTFLRRPSTERATSAMVHREFIVARNLKLIQSSLVRRCCLRNLLGLAWLGSDTAWFRQFSHDSIQTSPDESKLKLDVILACL
jgi:hypothetical protein